MKQKKRKNFRSLFSQLLKFEVFIKREKKLIISVANDRNKKKAVNQNLKYKT